MGVLHRAGLWGWDSGGRPISDHRLPPSFPAHSFGAKNSLNRKPLFRLVNLICPIRLNRKCKGGSRFILPCFFLNSWMQFLLRKNVPESCLVAHHAQPLDHSQWPVSGQEHMSRYVAASESYFFTMGSSGFIFTYSAPSFCSLAPVQHPLPLFQRYFHLPALTVGSD